MIICTTANTGMDLQGILDLQKANLAQSLSAEEMKSQGFVTVSHTYKELAKLNEYEKHIIAKDNEKVIAYLLAMTTHSKADIPILVPMFTVFGKTYYNHKLISRYKYIVVGQVCIGKAYRGQGIFDQCYAAYQEHYANKYDFAITEIAKTNTRSLKAHKRVGFTEIAGYVSPDGTEWVIVLWDWKR